MRCRQPGCTGTIVDGYCDVCGMPGNAATMPVGRGTPGRPPSATPSGPCRQPGCPGSVIDGYCDTCGMPPESAVTPTVSAVTKASVQLGSTALGSARATSFGARPVRRSPSTARLRMGRIGQGLTVVPPAPAVDPAKAVMSNPQLPEDKRVCPNCGAKVGQSRDDNAGRSDGFCPQCGAAYSFSPKLAHGDLVANQYEVVGPLAHGGMGWIYLARDKNVSDRWVVLKGLLNTGDADTLKATISEQQFLAQVEHPLIVEIYNFVTHDDNGYIVMEYVGGRSLKQLLQQRMEARGGSYDPLPVDQALAFLIEILPAFSYLHDLGLLYCDFKPDNVIQVGDSLKLIDLGGVRRANDDDSAIYGTVGYQAPEVAQAGATVASDIFTIGRTLMVLCAEVPGYQSEYEFGIPPAEQMPAFAQYDSLYRLLLKCCARDPGDRFDSAEELRQQMLGVLREVVATSAGGTASTSVSSPLFEAPTVSGNRFDWRQLPQLRRDPTDPQADWLNALDLNDPVDRLGSLARPPAVTTEVLLARCLAALETGNQRVLDQSVHTLLTEDPWEWRAVWMAGLGALLRGDHATALSSFNAVYGQLPGELAPKLALAVACELGGQQEVAESLYRICAATDANYVAPAGFGLARIRAARGDLTGSLTALELIPQTSRGYLESQKLKTEHLIALGNDAAHLAEALRVLQHARLDTRSQLTFEAAIHDKALALASKGAVKLGTVTLTEGDLRDKLEACYRQLAQLSADAAERADLVDKANAIRVWSLL
ncbi:MAG: tetratricopeptide repeat protein [Micropruina sp.]|uniref:serine/threonine-protein kinase n=1 Tax=Micropruina sp. TaxID=2737536 RepID=UPI0039E26016